MNQTIGVNITPQSFQPTLHFSQGDVGRVFVVNVTDYDIPTDATVTCVATKPSGMGFTVSGTVSGNSVTFTSTAEMTDEWGRFPAEIRIASGNTLLGTANFLMIGEKDPHPASTIDGTQEELIPQLTLLVNRVEAAAESVHDLTVSATTLTAGSDATATYDSTNNSIAFGIPRGADGDVTRSEFNDLKSDLEDITETVYSSNIFDQANATLTEGKYLNSNTGNEGTNASYCYVNEYIPIKANTKYFGTTFNKTSLERSGYFAGFILFYDSSKEFISGLSGGTNQNPFTTPANAKYMRISETINAVNNNYIMFEESITSTTTYVPYSETKKLKLPFILVDASGKGDFTTISEAVAAAETSGLIFVMSGVYEEQVSAWGKEVHIIGANRETCIIKDASGNYSTPPLEIGAGSVQNMTIIEQAEGAGTENMGAYAIHIEDNNLFNKKLLIRNCYIESDSSSAIGMGLRGGCSVRIEDCEIICAGARASAGAAPLYFHDADAQAYWGTANLYLHGNVLRNTASALFSMLTINSIHKENTTYMHMMYNIFVRSKTPSLSQKFNTWNTSGNTDADGWNGLSHMYLEDDSFGNNLSELNYS